MKQAEDKNKKAHALVYSLGNLTLLLLGSRYWMPTVFLIQYSVSSTEAPGESFLPLRRKRNGASVRERSWQRWCKVPSASWPLRIHHLFSSVSPLVFPFISLATPVRFRDTAASETQQPQRHSSLKDTAAARVQLFFQILHVAEHLVIKEHFVASLLTIAVLKFQLWNLFSATAWNRNVGAVPKSAQW